MSKLIFFFVLFFNYCFVSSTDIDYNDWSVVENGLFPTLPIAAPRSQNERCKKDSRLLMAHLKNKTFWAMQMWDGSVKTDAGILYGNAFQLGQFDECMLVKEPIKAQFCGVTIRAIINTSYDYGDPYDLDPDPYSTVWKKFKDSTFDPSKSFRDQVTLGLCVPASCSWKDLNESLNQHVQLLNSKSGPNDPKYLVSISEEWDCTKQTEPTYSWGEIFFWATTASLIGIQIVVAFYDLGERNKKISNGTNQKPGNFSHLQNMKVDETQLPQLIFLQGVKFISICIVVYGHRGLLTIASPMKNYQTYEAFARSPFSAITLNSDLVVDTFFFISGLLSCYCLLENYKQRYVNPLIVIFSRWMRLAPLYYFVVWFVANGLSKFGSGPLWNAVVETEVEKCKKNWWLSLLFLNNYIGVEESCVLHSWFISCEVQLFIAGSFLVFLISKTEKLGVSVLVTLTLITSLIPGIITYSYRLTPLILSYPEVFRDLRKTYTWQLLCIPTHARAGVYLIGMIAGYIIFKTKKSTIKLPRNYGGPLLILSLGLLISPMAYGTLYYDPRRPYNVIESSLFAIFRRFSWGLGYFICVMVSCFGKNIFLTILSRIKILLLLQLPLSKLTFSIYLLHFYMQLADVGTQRAPGYFSVYRLALAGSGDLLLVVAFAVVLYLLIELPFKKIFHELIFAEAIARRKKEIAAREKQTEFKYLVP